MVRTHQLVVIGHLDNLVNLSGVNQVVATHDRLVLGDRGGDVVEVVHLDKTTALDAVDASLAQCLADIRVVRGDLQFYGIFAC